VPMELIGAVSEPVTQRVAEGALQRSHADIVVSVTGVAGLGGGGLEKVGLVWFGLAQAPDVSRRSYCDPRGSGSASFCADPRAALATARGVRGCLHGSDEAMRSRHYPSLLVWHRTPSGRWHCRWVIRKKGFSTRRHNEGRGGRGGSMHALRAHAPLPFSLALNLPPCRNPCFAAHKHRPT
jgi:hypothetical protein